MDDGSEETRVGVVGGRGGVTAAVEAAGGRPVADDAASVTAADPDAVVAVGETALSELAAAGTAAPVLPVGAGRGVRSVPESAVATAVEDLLGGAWTAVEYPVVTVDAAVGSPTAAFDVMLSTAEPARISEYSVRDDDRRVARFRADGVVVATPAGSVGYARAADGPLVPPGVGVGPVVPVAPYATDPDHWVLPLSDVVLAVERDETPVELLVDGRVVGELTSERPAELSVSGSLVVAVVEESASFFRG